MTDLRYFKELYDLISRIWPQLIGYYVPIVAFFMDPRDQDVMEPEPCASLVVGQKAQPNCLNPKKSRDWTKIESLLTSKLLQDILAELPDDVDPDAKNELEELKEEFHQVGDPAYFAAVLQRQGLPVEGAGESMFSTFQSFESIRDYHQRQNNGATTNELRCRYRGELSLKLVDCLLGQPKATAKVSTECTLIPDMFRHRQRKELCTAFLTALIRQELPELKNYILLHSDAIQYPYRRDCVQLFLAVDPDFCQLVPSLLEADSSETDNSFLQQVIQIMFQKWEDIYQFALNNTNTKDIMDTDAVIRLAVRDLTEGRGLPSYTLFNQISATYSEGSVCNGTLAFSGNEMASEMLISFERPILLQTENVRYVRKLLEMTNGRGDDDYVLLVDIKNQFKPRILGLIPRKSCNDLYTVEFYGLVKWTLFKAGHEIVSYQDGTYLYRQKRFDKEIEILHEFLGCTKEEMGAIRYIVENAFEQKHGTMLVIFRKTEDAEEETERLVQLSRGIRLENSPNFAKTQNKKLLLSLSSIDGAIFLDRTGDAFGFGIIVDGYAKAEGTPERGARYNSAKNYVTCCGKENRPCAALVISEDHTLDVLRSPECEPSAEKRWKDRVSPRLRTDNSEVLLNPEHNR